MKIAGNAKRIRTEPRQGMWSGSSSSSPEGASFSMSLRLAVHWRGRARVMAWGRMRAKAAY